MQHQSVKLVALTQPTIRHETEDRFLTAEEFICYAARVSNPGNQNNTATAPRLIKYLIKNQHWSPFELSNATLEIQTTRDIGRQILRHRSFSFQEFSQRYAAVSGDGENGIFRETRLQDSTNRQKSLKIDPNNPEHLFIQREFNDSQRDAWSWAMGYYNHAIEAGVAKEQARALLPEGLTPTTMYMSGTLRSFIHWLQIREDETTTQLEHVDIAFKARAALAPHFPSVFKALNVSSG